MILKFLFFVLEEYATRRDDSPWINVEHIDYKNGYIEHYLTVRYKRKEILGTIKIVEDNRKEK